MFSSVAMAVQLNGPLEPTYRGRPDIRAHTIRLDDLVINASQHRERIRRAGSHLHVPGYLVSPKGITVLPVRKNTTEICHVDVHVSQYFRSIPHYLNVIDLIMGIASDLLSEHSLPALAYSQQEVNYVEVTSDDSSALLLQMPPVNDSSCAAILFDRQTYIQNIVGKAYVGTGCSRWGLGVVSGDSVDALSLILAHEILHIKSAPHVTTTECASEPTVMQPVLDDVVQPWSIASCTVNTVRSWADDNADCLLNQTGRSLKNPTPSDSVFLVFLGLFMVFSSMLSLWFTRM